MSEIKHSPQTMYGMLVSNAEIAREASLTGALSEGTKTLIAAYNRIIKALREMECLDELLFEEAPSDATMDEVGVLSLHLSKFLQSKFGCGTADDSGESGTGFLEDLRLS